MASTPSFYFEMKIVDSGGNDVNAIGITQSNPSSRSGSMPGWSYYSTDIGYHGDDGKIYYKNAKSKYANQAGLYFTGDVVGCLVYHTQIEDEDFIVVQFTNNGKKISYPRIIKTTDANSQFYQWYPTIGMASPGAVVDTNFGERPFLYLVQGKNHASLFLWLYYIKKMSYFAAEVTITIMRSTLQV